jgi:hypothetical protein
MKRKSARPPSTQPDTKFLRVLGDWKATRCTITVDQSHAHVLEYLVSPKGSIYRRAYSFEKPTLVIDSPVLPAEHHVRLMKIVDRSVIREVIKTLRRQERRAEKRK